MAPACRKCGAASSRAPNDRLCGACLLEVALLDEGGDCATPPILVDFGDYELLEELGRGGQGVVYRARQKGLNRIVALKIIGLGHWATDAHLKRFRLEAEAAARLDHPAIVPIYEIGERDGACFFSMKLIEGGHLDGLVRQNALSIREAADLLAKVARTVHYAHENGVLHRDIKPGNILLDGKGDPHLTDFGLARLVEKESNVTRTMDVLGTPSFMAPEQAAGKNEAVTSATDVYGLGAVFYHLLTGQPPFAGGTTYETIKLVCETEPRSPRLWNSKVDREVATICLKCLEKDPARRYSSALALAEDLERWLRHEPIIARRSGVIIRTRKWVRRNPLLAAGVPILAALTITLGLVLWQNAKDNPPPAGIAVLPFQNLSPDQDNAFLADGVQDDILTKLAKIADLKVISRTSVMQYRGERNVRKIGQILRVSHILEGSVHRVDGRIRINAQLIDARTDTHVWAETYERQRADVFAIESELAQAVAAQLSAKVSRAEKNAIEARPTKDLEAYNLYAQAKDLISKTNIVMDVDPFANYTQAVRLLEQSVAHDPGFTLAWSSLAEACLTLYWTPSKPPEWRDRAEAALNHAAQLAPDAGETHLARALFYYWGHRDYDHALEELEVAARLLPNSAQVAQLTSWVERRLFRWKECLRHGARAVELDPRNAPQRENLIRDHRVLRRYREAIRIADHAVTDFPDNDNLRISRAQLLLEAGDLSGARAGAATFSSDLTLNINKFFTRLGVLFYERKWEEAEHYAREQARLVTDDLMYPQECVEAPIARARNDSATAAAKFASCRDQLQSKLRERPGIWDWLSMLAVSHAALGEEEEALRDEATALSLPDRVERQEMILNLPMIYCWLGKRHQALTELERLVKTEIGVSYGDLKFNPGWDSLRDDPRFEKILEEAAKPLPF